MIENRYEQQYVMHNVIMRCCKCNNVEEQMIDIFENVMFIEQDCCSKCNDDIEIIQVNLGMMLNIMHYNNCHNYS